MNAGQDESVGTRLHQPPSGLFLPSKSPCSPDFARVSFSLPGWPPPATFSTDLTNHSATCLETKIDNGFALAGGSRFEQDGQLVCLQETTAPSSAWWWTSSRGRRTRSRAISLRSNG